MPIIRWVRTHYVATYFILAVLAVPIINWYNGYQQEVFERSPAGVIQAQQASEKQEHEDRRQISETLLRSSLRDPDSATFGGERTFQKNGHWVLCGMVNSRNGFGGMSGFQSFAVDGVQVFLASEGASSIDAIERSCN